MALQIVWICFFVVAFIVALVQFVFFQNYDIFKTITDGMFEAAKSAVLDVGLPLAGTIIFFLGLMNIAEKSGLVQILARLIQPFMSKLFPQVPSQHPAMGLMVMNFSANLLGLDNAATPFGLKAMQSLQELNPKKEVASNAQIMFMVLHTSGLTLVPLTIISYRIAAGSNNATSIFIPCILATLATTVFSILVVSFYQKLYKDRIIWLWIFVLMAVFAVFIVIVNSLSPQGKELLSKVGGNILLWVIIIGIIMYGFIKKQPIFDHFIDGAKNGLDVVFKIIPYLVAMLVGIRVFRDSGSFQYLTDFFITIIQGVGLPTDFVPSLPVAIMKPFSGSGSRGLLLDLYKTHGVDSFVSNVASIFQGSADTTFYIIALYFGSVGIKKIRYALWAGLLADFMGVIFAIFIGYLFFA